MICRGDQLQAGMIVKQIKRPWCTGVRGKPYRTSSGRGVVTQGRTITWDNGKRVLILGKNRYKVVFP